MVHSGLWTFACCRLSEANGYGGMSPVTRATGTELSLLRSYVTIIQIAFRYSVSGQLEITG